ncbi:RNase adapter RapZ [Bacillus hwajinpoensis]|jgi:RNase adapter protein RapZ|uniref:RNase adapter RapZ n=1 Tax=Guptibacillus hwajinpoensis TaxID=208199 RepID=A0A845ETU8_9BACL|nr:MULTISPECIES: RNase adapter RapZ [Bacillaceae]MYL61916.1 RNase adapter RapZ [Pseudalkalibacillus hwajinpoensis]QHA93356.1 RNase adapter RapZ [Bacillus sp. N1-1]
MTDLIDKRIHMVIITGMSGAGKTVAMQCFEDIGYFCIDNLPPALLPKFVEMVDGSEGKLNKVALVMDLRGGDFFDHLVEAVDHLDSHDRLDAEVLFLDSKDSTLVRRYKETRRSHPLAPEGLPLEGIQKEREMLEELKGRSQQIIDTSDIKPVQLREKIMDRFSNNEKENFGVNVMSFGFKYGIPIDADLVFDIRFLPNPHYVEHLRPKTGVEEEVANYVFKWKETQIFLEKLIDMLAYMLPQYKREGKSQLVIGIGCTGGKHRSVAFAEHIGHHFESEYRTNITHRDIEKGKGHK